MGYWEVGQITLPHRVVRGWTGYYMQSSARADEFVVPILQASNTPRFLGTSIKFKRGKSITDEARRCCGCFSVREFLCSCFSHTVWYAV